MNNFERTISKYQRRVANLLDNNVRTWEQKQAALTKIFGEFSAEVDGLGLDIHEAFEAWNRLMFDLMLRRDANTPEL